MLAYHDITDPLAFEAQLCYLTMRYQPVSAEQVVGAARGGEPLPPNAVWVTFDDGFPGVVEHGLRVLDAHATPGTLFVCPGVIDTSEPLWVDVVRDALAGRHGEELICRLKRIPDDERRKLVKDLQHRLVEQGRSPSRRQLSTEELRRWIARGHAVGNHTWDHPCLDQCTPHEQTTQIERADEWLRTRLDLAVSVFAYPNGNWSPTAERVLGSLGYCVAVGFDHRLGRTTRAPLRMSRLRVSAHADLARFRAILSGWHAEGLALRSRITGSATGDPRVLPHL